MNAKDAIQTAAGLTTFILTQYLDDLSDADLMQRPAPGCNHLAWQLGHLVASNASLLEMVCPDAAVKLPDGFAEAHDKATNSDDEPAHFHSKQEYLDLLAQVQSAAQAALDGLSEADLDKPSPEKFREMFPTVGHMYILIATHGLMHAGQFVPVRRALDKPVVI